MGIVIATGAALGALAIVTVLFAALSVAQFVAFQQEENNEN